MTKHHSAPVSCHVAQWSSKFCDAFHSFDLKGCQVEQGPPLHLDVRAYQCVQPESHRRCAHVGACGHSLSLLAARGALICGRRPPRSLDLGRRRGCLARAGGLRSFGYPVVSCHCRADDVYPNSGCGALAANWALLLHPAPQSRAAGRATRLYRALTHAHRPRTGPSALQGADAYRGGAGLAGGLALSCRRCIPTLYGWWFWADHRGSVAGTSASMSRRTRGL